MPRKLRIFFNDQGKSIWKIVLFMVLLVSFCLIPEVLPDPEKSRPDNEIIRFHVLANSNNRHDQEIKNFLAGRLIEIFGPFWKRCQSSEELHALLKKDKRLIGETAGMILAENGFSDPVTVEFGKSHFPARFYGDRFYPSGEYTSLIIKIGAGKGENWWCVLFPPLCFTVFPPAADKEDIGDIKENNYKENNEEGVISTKIEIDKATEQGSRLGNDEAPLEKRKSKWRFWIVDFIAGIFQK